MRSEFGWALIVGTVITAGAIGVMGCGSSGPIAVGFPETVESEGYETTAENDAAEVDAAEVDGPTLEPPTAEPEDVSEPPTAEPEDISAQSAKCSEGANLLFRGRSDGDGLGADDQRHGPVEAAVCRFSSGELEYHGVDLESGREIRLPACKVDQDNWRAFNDGYTYSLNDGRDADAGALGRLTLTDPAGEWTIWNLYIGIVGNRELQEQPATVCPPTPD